MKAPSFFIEYEDHSCLHMQYRTRRKGFHFYVQGQVKELAKMLFIHTKQFENKLDCKLKKQEIVFDTAVFHYELTFTNNGFLEYKKAIEERKDTSMPIRAGVFFSMFPFCILFEKDMVIKNMGSALRYCIPQSIGRKLGEFWELIKPLVDFKYEVIESRLNSMFELATLDEIDKLREKESGKSHDSETLELDDLEDIDKTLHIKGQMVFIQEWQLMMFLACPIMKGLNNLIWSGLFINDLSMHDYSRDIMLANAQQDMEVGLAKMQLNKKIALTKTNEEKAATMKKRNDDLGYMFLPTQVTIDIVSGKDPKDMSTKIDRASFLMVDIAGAADFSKGKPDEVVNFYNNMESVWDHIVKINKCFKLDRKTEYFVTTAGSDKLDSPVEQIANCALDMMDAGHRALMDPVTGKPIKISLAIGTGATVTAVSQGSVPKFGVYGGPVTAATFMVLQAPENCILLCPNTKSFLPNMYKVKEFKDVAGVGMASILQDREGRKPLSDKDILSLAPVKKSDGKDKDEAKTDEKKEGAQGSDGAEASSSGGGDDSNHAEGEATGGDDSAGGENSANSDEAQGEDTVAEDGGEVKLRPVSVANTTQCCGGLKSGVCTLI